MLEGYPVQKEKIMNKNQRNFKDHAGKLKGKLDFAMQKKEDI